jgi:hypothetical protein
MGLREQQDLLARIYTDPGCRSSFAADPLAVGREAGLSSKEIHDIFAVSSDELHVFSESLFWKRARQVEKLLPVTALLLEPDLEKYFRHFCQSHSGPTNKHLDDARAFARYVIKTNSIPSAVRDAARFESARLAFFHGFRRLLLVRAKYLGEPAAPTGKRRFRILLRLRGRVYRFGGWSRK